MPISIMEMEILNPQVLRIAGGDFERLSRRFSRGKLRGLMEKVRDEVLIPSIDTNFKTAGRPPWEPITESTQFWRTGSSRGSGVTSADYPLVNTGQLQKAATARARFTIRENRMSYGNFPSRRWFAGLLDAGFVTNFGIEVPARPFAVMQHPEDTDHIQEVGLEWIEDAVGDEIRLYYV